MSYEEIISRHTRPLFPVPTGLKPLWKCKGEIKAVIFDIYGTLLISDSGDIGSAESRDLRWEKIEPVLLRHKTGLSYRDAAHKYFALIKETHEDMKKRGIGFPEVKIDEIWARILNTSDKGLARRVALEVELVINPVWAMPGLVETIGFLQNSGITMGIISNAQFFTEPILSYFIGKPLPSAGFAKELVLYSYRLGRAKPDPLLFEMAAERLSCMGITPSRSIYVGNDVKNDISPAKKTGFMAVLFAGDKRSLRLRRDDPSLANTSWDAQITDLRQIISGLSGLPPGSEKI